MTENKKSQKKGFSIRKDKKKIRRKASLGELPVANDPTVFYKIELRPFAICAAIVLFFAAAAHTISLWGNFVYMDSVYIDPLNNLREQGKIWSDLFLKFLLEPLSQPLVQATFLVDVQSGQLKSAAIYHMVNVGVHIINSLLLFALALRIGKYQEADGKLKSDPYIIATIAASIFACHPLACEAVSYISARQALLMTMYYLSSIHLFMTGFLSADIKKAVLAYLGCYFSMACSIWSGDQAITAPLACISLALLLKPRAETFKTWIFYRLFEFFAQALVAIALPLVLLTQYVAPVGNGFGLESLGKVAYVATQFKLLVAYYLRCFLVPYGLSLDPNIAYATSFADPLTIIGLLSILLLLFLAFKFKDSTLLSFALIFFLLSLIPFTIVVQPEVVSDRRIYLGLGALSIPCGMLLARLSLNKTIIAMATTIILLVGLTGLSNWRNWQWHNNIRIWKTTLDQNPDSTRSRAMYAWALAYGGKFSQGAKYAEKEYEKNPHKAILSVILGTHYSDRDAKKEKQFFEEGLKLAQKQHLSTEIVWRIQAGLADAAYKTGDYKTAVRMSSKALEVQPNNTLIYLTLGKAYLALYNPNAAYLELHKAYTISRMRNQQLPEVIVPLARAALGCGTEKFQDLAYGISLQARRVFGTVPEVILLQAYAALETGRVHESMRYISLFLNSEKPTPETYYLLYGVQKKLGNEKNAATFLRWARASDPDIEKKMVLTLKRKIQDDDSKQKLSKEEEKKLELEAPDSAKEGN